jgi:hypothetical protein
VKRLLLVLVLTLTVAGAIPAQASANHTLAHKVSNLVKKVNRLQAEVNCLRRTGAGTYLGYPYYEGIFDPANPGPYPIHDPSSGFDDSDFAANFVHAVGGGPADYWLVTLNNTRACRNRFTVVRNPYAQPLPRAAQMRARQLLNLPR